MHDSESDTFAQKNKQEELLELLEKIGVSAKINQIDAEDNEKDNDYYSKHFTNTPSMITNHGYIKIENSNIDVIQILQKG